MKFMLSVLAVLAMASVASAGSWAKGQKGVQIKCPDFTMSGIYQAAASYGKITDITITKESTVHVTFGEDYVLNIQSGSGCMIFRALK